MTSSCVLLVFCRIYQGLALCSSWEGKAKGVDTNESELLFLPGLRVCYSAFDPCSGCPTALQVSACLLQPTASSACLGGELSGQLSAICSGRGVQDLRLPLGPALLSGG